MKSRMSARLSFMLLFVIVVSLIAGGRTVAAAPPAPSPVSPADGSTVGVPFIIAWTAVSDPSGIAGYNWQVSSSSAFTSVLLQSSTNGALQDTVSGLANGTYFWRVQAVSGAFVQGAWSQPSSFTVTGADTGAPSLGPPRGYSTFHPSEVMTFTWSAVPDAATYVLQYSTDAGFSFSSRGEFNNIPDPTFSFAIGNPEGNYFARVFAVDASGVLSPPSNVISFSVFYNNPLPPPPSPVAPANGTTLTLPVTISWTDVPNPQPSGYELQIARDSSFNSIEVQDSQLTDSTRQILSLTSGTKFWRVRSAQGAASPTTAAVTNWSATGTFAISSAPPVPVSVVLAKNPLYSGETVSVAVQLTAAVPAGGASINLSSSNPSAVPVPATITMPGNTAWTQFQVQAEQVTAPTPITLTASLNSGSASVPFTLLPPSLKLFMISPSTISGGAQPQGIVLLNGQAPAGGALVSLSSNSPSVSPPSSVLIAAGSPSASFPIPTSAVTANTTATVTASYGGASAQAQVTLTPQQPPLSLTLDPTSTIGSGGSSFATVRVASPSSTDQILQVASSNPAVASVPNAMIIPAGTTAGGFNIFTSAVSTQTVVTISVSGGGVTRSANLTVNPTAPTPPPTPVAPSLLSPASNERVPQPITFDWTDAANATSYEIQIDDSSNFTAPLIFRQTVAVSQATVTDLPTQRLFWRVRAFNSAGVAGPFSGSRRFNAQAASATPSLSAVSVSPTSIVGGSSSQGTVTLTGAAPSGGAVVALSDNSASAATPASVTVPAGATSASFTITTSSVSASTAVTITGSFGGVTRTATLTVQPQPASVTLSTLTVNPTAVVGGNSSQGTVTLTGAAPSGGAVVALSDNSAAATVPASVTVGAGATSASFTITTSSVAASTPVTITGSFGGASRTATLTVQPQPASVTLSTLTMNPTSVIGGNSSQGTVTLTGPAPSGGAVVTLSDNSASATTPASVTVGAGATSATFTVTTVGVNASTTATITGSFGGATRTATLTVNSQATTDTVAIQRAEFSSGRLRVEATSTSSNATLTVFVTSTNTRIGVLQNDGGGRYRGEFNWPSNPGNITVRSSLGGSASRSVSAN